VSRPPVGSAPLTQQCGAFSDQLLQPFSGKVIQLTVCPDLEPTSFAASLADFFKSTELVTSIATTPNACDANPVRLVGKEDNLLKVLTDLLT